MNSPLMKSLGSKPRTGSVKNCLYCGCLFYKQPAHADRKLCGFSCYLLSVNLPFIADTQETIVPIPGFNLLATSQGRILAFNNEGFVYQKKTYSVKDHYFALKTPKNLYVHRLVAMAYLGTPKEGLEVNHKDGDKHNNKPENLEWVTKSENMLHAARNGLLNIKRGEDSHSAKLTQKEVDKIRKMKGLKTYRNIAVLFGVKYSTIAHIMRGSRW